MWRASGAARYFKSPSSEALESALPTALRRGEFRLYYQPQVRASDGRVIGGEALIGQEGPREAVGGAVDALCSGEVELATRRQLTPRPATTS